MEVPDVPHPTAVVPTVAVAVPVSHTAAASLSGYLHRVRLRQQAGGECERGRRAHL